jgi:hypothetical protein
MRNFAVAGACTLAVVLALHPAMAGGPRLKKDIFGIHPEMPKTEVEKRLQEVGKFQRNEEKRQQVWQVRHKSFSHLIVGFDPDDKLRYVTAVAREDKDAKRVAYDEIGDLKEAHQAGDPSIKNFQYQWTLPAKNDSEIMVIAAGRDAKFLATYSLKSIGGKESREEKD